MSIPNYLANIKSAGVYRYVFDKSQIPSSVDQSALRLLVGYSEKGPFNTPVYIESASDFITTFGNISRRLERKGVFFHRLALQALQAGPILALNLKPFNQDTAYPEYAALYGFNASDIGENQRHIGVCKALVAATTKGQRDVNLNAIYDTNRFWKVDAERLHDIQMLTPDSSGNWTELAKPEHGSNDYVRIVQTSSVDDSCTIFIRPAVPTGYNVKISDWYSAETSQDMPPYMDSIKDHMLSEFFAEVVVFKGDLAKSDLFRHTGTLGSNLPIQFIYAKDEDDKPLSWDFSGEYPVLEKVYAYNDDGVPEYFRVSKVNNVKAVYRVTTSPAAGSPESPTFEIERVAAQYSTNGTIQITGTVPAESANKKVDFVGYVYEWDVVDEDDTTEDNRDGLKLKSWIKYAEKKNIVEGTTKEYEYEMPKKTFIPSTAVSKDVAIVSTVASGTYNCTICGSSLFTSPENLDGNTPVNKIIATTSDEQYLSWQPFCIVVSEDDSVTGKPKSFVKTNNKFRDSYGQFTDALAAMADVSTSNYVASYQGIMFPEFKDANGNYVSLDVIFNSDYTNHKMLMKFNAELLDEAADLDENGSGKYGDDERGKEWHGAHTHTTDIKKGESGDWNADVDHFGSVAGFVHALTSAVHSVDGVDNGEGADIKKYKDNVWTNAGKSVTGLYMEGYRYNSIMRAERGRALIDKIYGVLQYKGIREALTNNVDIDYHYLVDTFQGYPGFAMKAQLASIAKAKDNALAILNFPPMEDVVTHCGFSKYDGGFSMKEIAKGSSGISLPTENQGASWSAFYTQLVMNDGGSKITIPSAAIVSNLFMEKVSKRLPYYIVAGPNYGRISYPGITGPDYNYARQDLDVLEPFGVNAIVHIPRIGIVINSNQTAKQTPVSALSKVHVRELTIFVQDEIEKMLRGYQWELNTPTLREKIKAKADTILGLVLANGGIYDFRTKCDEDNNTPEIIDNEMVVLDVEIEPARGAGKMVQTLTIHRTGGISSLASN